MAEEAKRHYGEVVVTVAPGKWTKARRKKAGHHLLLDDAGRVVAVKLRDVTIEPSKIVDYAREVLRG